MYKNFSNQIGISPIIGVILLVAVTVALVSLATFIIFNLGTDVTDTADTTVQTSTGADGIEVQVLRNKNVEKFELIGPNGRTNTVNGDIGNNSNIGDGPGRYTIQAILDDGTEEVIDTIDVDEDSPAAIARTPTYESEGYVTINPDIEGAEIRSIEDGVIIDETTTDSNGEYKIGVSDESEILVTVDGFKNTDLENELYASAIKPVNGEDMTFTFEKEEIKIEEDETVYISNSIEEEQSDTKTINSIYELQGIKYNLTANYQLISDINANKTGKFTPIGDNENTFRGNLNGQEYKIKNLHINKSETNNVGLFGYSEGNIKNIELINTNITGSDSVGGIVAVNKGSINTSYVEGSINDANNAVGGIAGWNKNGIITNSYVKGNISGKESTGGIVGWNNNSSIKNSYTIGDINGTDSVGGIVGYNDKNVIESYSKGSVAGDFSVGGIVGYNEGIVNKSYANSNIEGKEQLGGLVGYNFDSEVSESYAKGSLNGEKRIGGLIGWNQNSQLTNSYSTGDINGKEKIGGFVGDNDDSTVISSYWDIESSGEDLSAAGTGLETDDMQGDEYNSDFEDDIVDNDVFFGVENEYPILEWQE